MNARSGEGRFKGGGLGRLLLKCLPGFVLHVLSTGAASVSTAGAGDGPGEASDATVGTRTSRGWGWACGAGLLGLLLERGQQSNHRLVLGQHNRLLLQVVPEAEVGALGHEVHDTLVLLEEDGQVKRGVAVGVLEVWVDRGLLQQELHHLSVPADCSDVEVGDTECILLVQVDLLGNPLLHVAEHVHRALLPLLLDVFLSFHALGFHLLLNDSLNFGVGDEIEREVSLRVDRKRVRTVVEEEVAYPPVPPRRRGVEWCPPIVILPRDTGAPSDEHRGNVEIVLNARSVQRCHPIGIRRVHVYPCIQHLIHRLDVSVRDMIMQDDLGRKYNIARALRRWLDLGL
eukprot:m.122578 g.122578  ORF g.122578 m.122578 type:complete len:343 (-) comp21963_c0_seq2:319-1347(-)